MRDYIGQHDWWNKPIKNKTQNKYTRFMKMPEGELKSKYWHTDELKSVYFREIK